MEHSFDAITKEIEEVKQEIARLQKKLVELRNKAHKQAHKQLGHHHPLVVLSRRERQIFDILITGLSNKEIASILNISERTVKFHVSGIFAKLDFRSRYELIRWYVDRSGTLG